MARRFYTLDVFTDEALSGNPLAVVLDSDGLDQDAMQTIATEFNLSETVFVFPPDKEENRARIKIYTPVHELPFAGHPTVGTAYLLSHLDGLSDDAELVLEEVVGPVNCAITDTDGKRKIRFELPKISERIDWTVGADKLAEAIGLQPEDMGFDEHEVSIWDGGVPYMLVPLSSINAVQNIEINSVLLKEIEPVINGINANIYAYCRGGESSSAAYHARMFAPFQGIPEDPATGSAVASFSGQIAQYDMQETDTGEFLIEQGYEMGRPSQIVLDLTKDQGNTTAAGISGGAVIVSKGELLI